EIAPPFKPQPSGPGSYPLLAHVSASYPGLTGRLPTCYSPVRHSGCRTSVPRNPIQPCYEAKPSSKPLTADVRHPAFDLHVLGTPPAFVLSQDQTLHGICALSRSPSKGRSKVSFETYSFHYICVTHVTR